VKNLGFSWNGSFVVNWHPEASFIPYYSNDYGFYVVSIEGVKIPAMFYAIQPQLLLEKQLKNGAKLFKNILIFIKRRDSLYHRISSIFFN